MALEPKEIKRRSILTLYGSSQADGSISFCHPRLDFGLRQQADGEGGGGSGGEKGKGRFKNNGGNINGTCSFSHLKSPCAGERHAVTGP